MSINKIQRDYLALLANSAHQQDQADERTRQQQAVLTEVAQLLTPARKEDLRKQMDFEVEAATQEKKGRFALKKTKTKVLKTLDPGGQIKSFEAEEAGQTKGFASRRQKNAAHAGTTFVAQLSTLMREAVDSNGKQLFDADEITTELYEPLVREGLFPETFVRQEYSATHKLLSNALKHYKEGIELAATEEAEEVAGTQVSRYSQDKKEKLGAYGDMAERKFDDLTSKLGGGETRAERLRSLSRRGANAGAVLSLFMAGKAIHTSTTNFIALGSAGEAAAGIVAGGQEEEQQIDPAMVTAASVMAAKATGQFVADLAKQADDVKQANNKLAKDKKASLADMDADARMNVAAADLYISWSNALESALKGISEPAARTIGKAFRTKMKPQALVKLGTAEPLDTAKMIAQLSGEIAAAFTAAAPKGQEDLFKKVAAEATDKFKAAVKEADLKHAIADGDDPLGPVELAGRKAIKGVFGILVADDDDDNNPAQATQQRGALSPDAQTLADQVQDDDVVDAMEKTLQAEQNKETEEQYLEHQKELKKLKNELLNLDAGGDAVQESQTVKALLLNFKKKQKVLALAETLAAGLPGLGVGGVRIASQVALDATTALGGVGPLLKAAGLSAKLVFEILEAAEWGMMFKEFAEKRLGSKKAGSALDPAIKGLMKKCNSQMTYTMIQSALTFAQVAGEATAAGGGFAVLGGISAPVGVAVLACGKMVSYSAGAGKKMHEAAYMEYEERKLQKAWYTTKCAFDNPANRKLGLKALKDNGTLALHAIVWAAKEKNDPVALDVMSVFKITEQMLGKEEDAAHAKVIEYMMVVLRDNKGLLDPEKKISDWQPRKPELSRKGWLVAKKRGETLAEPKLLVDKTTAIEKALAALEKHPVPPGPAASMQLPPDAKPVDDATRKAMEADLEAVRDAFKAYSPVDERGKPHAEMMALKSQFETLLTEHGLKLASLPKPASPVQGP